MNQDFRATLQAVRVFRYCFLFLPFLPCTGTAATGVGCARFNHHCWIIPTKLRVRIYTAKPLEMGEIINRPAIVTGMIFIIICCCGSVLVMGVILETKYMERPMMIGNT